MVMGEVDQPDVQFQMLQEIYGGGNQSKLKEGISDEQEIRNEIEAPTIKYKTPAKESLRDGNTDTQEIRNHIEEHNEKIEHKKT
jgi:hypothetical protein